ncbi:hypothetical protein COLO4_32058 [Corchorus olitorius]|uniref:Uncharacterized protein n=1 Tax=Corchorus olitorius TaxID=93759 RepID=A0A1R3H256_9ROSI|nr:hypothetical protein COLO4_32058 [Corchorus olitorius]
MVCSLPFSCFLVFLFESDGGVPVGEVGTAEVEWGTGRVSCSQPESAE